MAEPGTELDLLLRSIAETGTAPWYPKLRAAAMAIPRDTLDGSLNDLRLAGMIRLTEWERETGQGYLLTPFGKEVLDNSHMLNRLRQGLRPSLDEIRGDPVPEPVAKPTTLERGEAARKALLFPEKPRVTPVLMIINLVCFAASLALALRRDVPLSRFIQEGDAGVLHDSGALSALDLVNGDWWRLLTCCFLHFGLFHLGMNMYSLYFSGNRLESLWGSSRFLLIYLLAGVGGSAAALVFDPGSPTSLKLLAGASGALWGIMLSAPTWIMLNREFIPGKVMREWFSQWWMVFLLNLVVSFLPNISASAHFGGGIIGVLVSVLLYFLENGQPRLRQFCAVVLGMVPVVCFGVVHQAMENDPRWQRIAQVKIEMERNRALTELRDKIAKPVAEFTAELEKWDGQITPLLYRELSMRRAEEIAAAKSALETLGESAKKVREQIPAKVHPDEHVEQLRKSAQDLLNSADVLIAHLRPLIDKPVPEGDADKELRALRRAFAAAVVDWNLKLYR